MRRVGVTGVVGIDRGSPAPARGAAAVGALGTGGATWEGRGHRTKASGKYPSMCMRNEEWGGGVWNPKVCVPKMADINISFCKFQYFPL